MITQRAANYGTVLYSLQIAETIVKQSQEILQENSQLVEALDNPTVKKGEKDAVIDAVFPKEIRNFLKVLCRNNHIEINQQIFEAYEDIVLKNENRMKAELSYVIELEEEEINQIKEMIGTKYNKTGVDLELKEDSSLIAGFVLTVGDTEYDKSIKGTLEELQKALVGR